MMRYQIFCNLPRPARCNNVVARRDFWQWLTFVFNRVDEARIKEIGPDRACAEWLLRNGAAVRWAGAREYLRDYDALQRSTPSYHIVGVDATDSSISHIGFPYFVGCRYIEEMKLVNCSYIENRALPMLCVLKDSLKDLEVVNCGNVTESGLRSLKDLKNLRRLKLGGMPYLKDKSLILKELREALPSRQMEFND